MGEYVALIFIGGIVMLFIAWLISSEFQFIAEQKGHVSRKYFWFCFLFGIIGYLMVIALPDRRASYTPPQAPRVPAPTETPISSVETPSSSDSTPYRGKMGGTTDAVVGAYSIQCQQCCLWQSKSNTACVRCGAVFIAFIEK